MLFIRNYKKYHSVLSLSLNFKQNIILSYTDNLMLTKSGYLRSPSALFNNNMCLFSAFDNLNDVKLISYKGYIITNIKIINKGLGDCFSINNFMLVIMLHNIVKIYGVLLNIIYKILYLIFNYNI